LTQDSSLMETGQSGTPVTSPVAEATFCRADKVLLGAQPAAGPAPARGSAGRVLYSFESAFLRRQLCRCCAPTATMLSGQDQGQVGTSC
jgi:hypothetical protein